MGLPTSACLRFPLQAPFSSSRSRAHVQSCRAVDLSFSVGPPAHLRYAGDLTGAHVAMTFMGATSPLHPLLSQTGTTSDSGMEDTGASQLAPLQEFAKCPSACRVASVAPQPL